MNNIFPKLYPLGDQAIVVEFGDEISVEVNKNVLKLANKLRSSSINGMIEWVPSYTSLTIYYRPIKIKYTQIKQTIELLIDQLDDLQEEERTLIEIPALYGDEYGPDLEDVAKYHGITVEQVIKLHTNQTYRIYMLGFSPGFPYLGGLHPGLHTPRLSKPRIKVPSGSIGIAGSQTGIYSTTSPGGWRIIGQTPLPLFNPKNEQHPILLKHGYDIRFFSIEREEFMEIKKNVQQNGSYIQRFLIKGGVEDENRSK